MSLSMTNKPKIPEYDHIPQDYEGPSFEKTMKLRQANMNPGLFLYYKNPIMIVEGSMQYVYDQHGKRYLDAFGGIVTTSVGHAQPDVVNAASKQMSKISHTTTIYLNNVIAEYAEKLADTMPGDLKVCYFVNSGSEANDLALLMSRLYTGNYDVIALRNAHLAAELVQRAISNRNKRMALPRLLCAPLAQGDESERMLRKAFSFME